MIVHHRAERRAEILAAMTEPKKLVLRSPS
jgi:hypothetical protein